MDINEDQIQKWLNEGTPDAAPKEVRPVAEQEPVAAEAFVEETPVVAVAAVDDRKEIQKLSSEFNHTVFQAKAAIFTERLVPRLVPPLCTGGLFLTASWLGLWAALPPVGCIAGVIAFATAFVASPFLVHSGSLLVTEQEALRRLDANLGEGARPAQTLRDTLAETNPPVAQKVWDLHITDLWKKWGGKFSAGAPHVDVQSYDPLYLRYGMAALTLAAALIAGGDRFSRLADAFNWQSPAPPPMAVKAWVTPPKFINDPPLYLTEETRDEAHGGTKLTAHKNSTLTILTYDAEAKVLVDGVELPVLSVIPALPGAGKDSKSAYQYETPLVNENTSITITKGPEWKFDVSPDAAPQAAINTVNPEAKTPNILSVIYQVKDDFGIQEGQLQIKPVGASEDAQPLPSAKLPPLTIR